MGVGPGGLQPLLERGVGKAGAEKSKTANTALIACESGRSTNRRHNRVRKLLNPVGKSVKRPHISKSSHSKEGISEVASQENSNPEQNIEHLNLGSPMQNRSHAVMAQRAELKTSLDDFPTPPWATRALIEHAVSSKEPLRSMTCLEPACGRGHMSVALADYFRDVVSYDVFDYGFAETADFLKAKHGDASFDWVITNPPFKLGEDFIRRSLKIARCGVAMLARTVFIESVGRFDRLFEPNPPSVFAQFVERVPMVKGRLDKKASTATGYGWLIWEKGQPEGTRLAWIPPCRKVLERDGDYQQSPRMIDRRTSATVVLIAIKAQDLFSK